MSFLALSIIANNENIGDCGIQIFKYILYTIRVHLTSHC